MAKRFIKINGTNLKLPVSKLTSIKSDQMMSIHFDKLKDGTWRIIYNERLIPDFSKIKSFEIIREE